MQSLSALDIRSNSDVKDILAQCYVNDAVFAKTIFPERFNLPFSSIHQTVFEAMESGRQKIVIAAPRGFGKTTISNLLFPAKKILFRDKRFIVPISNTATQATMQSENLKAELCSNTLVRSFFGDVKSSETFSKDMWVAYADPEAGDPGVVILPRGAGQQIRGFNWRGFRPDLIIGDDLENAEDVRNPDTRKKIKEWFFADVMNSVDRSKNWQIIVVGTVLHEDSLLENLLNDPTWFPIRLEICDDNYHSNWPDLLSDSAVRELANMYRAQGLLDVFYREYRNMPISTEDATFRKEYFRYYKEVDEDFLREKRGLETVVLLDPAKTVKIHSAESGIITLGLDRKQGRIYVRNVIAEKLYPDQIYKAVLDQAVQFNATAIGIEVTSLNEFITYPFKNEMVKRGKIYPLIELKAVGKKEERIASMVPFYRGGHVIHNEECAGVLEGQLLSFPRCTRFDAIDALAYFVKLFDIGDRFFESEKADEDEYADLAEMEPLPLMESWRIA
jgi:hypothetical protein